MFIEQSVESEQFNRNWSYRLFFFINALFAYDRLIQIRMTAALRQVSCDTANGTMSKRTESRHTSKIRFCFRVKD
jgi:hypothetical protein